MERKSREKQTPIEFRRRKILSDVGKSTDVSPEATKSTQFGVSDDSGNRIASPTPEKSDRKLCSKGKQSHDNSSQILPEAPEITFKSTELPEKLKSLADLFDRMISSVRLLGLKKRMLSFRNICTQVEIMTKRKFSYSHLAQMKYIFPDAILIEKVLVHDERSLCMLPDLKVSILFDTIGCPSYPGKSAFMALCHAFRARLLEQFNSNQDVEIPEAVLPEPFNRRNDIECLDSLLEEFPNESIQQPSVELDSFLRLSHFSSSFRKRFCEKIIVPEAERSEVLASSLSIPCDTEVKASKNIDKTSLTDVRSFHEAVYVPSDNQLVERTPVKGTSTAYDMVGEVTGTPSSCNISKTCQSTPTCDGQNESVVVAETPVMQTPKRPVPSPTEVLSSVNEKTVSGTKSTPSVRRTLLYSPQKLDLCFNSEEQPQVYEHSSVEAFSIKRSICDQEAITTCDTTAGSNDSPKLSQSKSEKRQALLDCLPAMFDTIHFISQSVDCSLITKQELVHKIISNNLDIEETGEVEEQLGLLEELVPDWMCKKSTCNGEFLYCINKVADPNAVRIRLSGSA